MRPLTEIFETGREKLPVMLTWVPDVPGMALIEETASVCTGAGTGPGPGIGIGPGVGVGVYAVTATTML